MLRGRMMDKYFIIRDENDDAVHVSMHPPSYPYEDYLNSFINIWVNDDSIDSPFKTLDEAEEFIMKVMELLKE